MVERECMVVAYARVPLYIFIPGPLRRLCAKILLHVDCFAIFRDFAYGFKIVHRSINFPLERRSHSDHNLKVLVLRGLPPSDGWVLFATSARLWGMALGNVVPATMRRYFLTIWARLGNVLRVGEVELLEDALRIAGLEQLVERDVGALCRYVMSLHWLFGLEDE